MSRIVPYVDWMSIHWQVTLYENLFLNVTLHTVCGFTKYLLSLCFPGLTPIPHLSWSVWKTLLKPHASSRHNGERATG